MCAGVLVLSAETLFVNKLSKVLPANCNWLVCCLTSIIVVTLSLTVPTYDVFLFVLFLSPTDALRRPIAATTSFLCPRIGLIPSSVSRSGELTCLLTQYLP